jgi:thymidylate synthase
MTHVYEADTADLVWRAAAAKFGEADAADLQSGRGGPTLEQLHAAFAIRDPRQRWVVSRRPAINPAFAIAEVVWILNGRDDAAFLNHWFPGLPRYAGGGDRYHAAYGHRLRKGFGFDQLERAYHALRNNPDSRQVVLQIWNPQIDFPDDAGKPVAADIPCNICAFPKIRNDRLEWLQVMRSNDLQRGLPYNFIQFTTLQEVMAGWLGVRLGSYNHVSDSLHVYEREVADVRAFTPVEGERNSDTLCLGWAESGAAFGEMSHLMDVIISPGLAQKDLLALVTSCVLPQPYHNLLLVVAAEGARRRGWELVANELMTDCTNPALTQAWDNWIARCRVPQRPA